MFKLIIFANSTEVYETMVAEGSYTQATWCYWTVQLNIDSFVDTTAKRYKTPCDVIRRPDLCHTCSWLMRISGNNLCKLHA